MRLKGREDGAWNLLGKEWEIYCVQRRNDTRVDPETLQIRPRASPPGRSMMDES
jgi:hypothetical protein